MSTWEDRLRAAHPKPADEVAATHGPYLRTQHHDQLFNYRCDQCKNEPCGEFDHERDYWNPGRPVEVSDYYYHFNLYHLWFWRTPDYKRRYSFRDPPNPQPQRLTCWTICGDCYGEPDTDSWDSTP